MKIIKKIKTGNKRQVYVFGKKILSYKRKDKNKSIPQVLFALNQLSKKVEQINKMQDNIQLLLKIPEYKEEIKNYQLFDEKYYREQYPNIEYYNVDSLDHYLQYGWKLGLNPSPRFNTNQYLEEYPKIGNICPLIHYLHKNRYVCGYCFFSNPYEAHHEEIVAYQEYKKTRKTKKVVYTCIVGGYDNLINHKYINQDWDYICFTDNEDLIKEKIFGIWEIRKAQQEQLDATRINRFYKINPHLCLSEYEESIYIDGNINILTPFIFDLISSRNQALLAPKHFATTCIYKHFDWAIRVSADNRHLLLGLKSLIETEKFPKDYGFTENNLLYRRHNEDSIKSIMEDWWYLVKYYAKRDQLSFCYVLWKHNIKPQEIFIENLRSDNENFAFIKHIKERN